LLLFGDRRCLLRDWRDDAGRRLFEERGLRLKHPQARVISCQGHLDALGYGITREGITALPPRALTRLRRRVAAEMARPSHRPRQVDLERSIASSAGIVLF
jgi:hypothetical protein